MTKTIIVTIEFADEQLDALDTFEELLGRLRYQLKMKRFTIETDDLIEDMLKDTLLLK